MIRGLAVVMTLLNVCYGQEEMFLLTIGRLLQQCLHMKVLK